MQMQSVFEVATSASTPLALAGFIAAVLFFLLKQVLRSSLLERLTSEHSAIVVKRVVDRLFVLALVAMSLGFIAYLLPPKQTATVLSPQLGQKLSASANLTLVERYLKSGKTQSVRHYHEGQGGSVSEWHPVAPDSGWTIVEGSLKPVIDKEEATGGTTQFCKVEYEEQPNPRFRVYSQPTSRHHGVALTAHIEFIQYRVIERRSVIDNDAKVRVFDTFANEVRIEVEYSDGKKATFRESGEDDRLVVSINRERQRIEVKAKLGYVGG